jgi:hypothetical protein
VGGLVYQPDGRDRVRRLPDVPQSDVGAPLPVVVADEHTVLLAYHARPKPTLEELAEIEMPRIVDAGTGGSIAVVSFRRTHASFFGPPNDEAFAGHPLAARGLEPYGAFEIERSSWIREAERRNRVHPYHRAEAFDALRHFAFTFHDTVFEALAVEFDVRMMEGSIVTALRAMADRLASDA